jgi:hypothetical protein
VTGLALRRCAKRDNAQERTVSAGEWLKWNESEIRYEQYTEDQEDRRQELKAVG